ncbi:DUF6498-containing protein [Smaragdicoccus niigatensis]|uniref:DUF6498-containing protein n=1 Tax=Smaragdicoccus niigatensis TaxID=359359 RepID=UPI000381E925|nr:DUF6498-containing protein [Smaragdicoccus niigatensis]
MFTLILHALTFVGINAVPATGWFLDDWTSGTLLAVYWFENIAATFFIAGRIALQQRWKPMRGHFRYQGRQGTKGSQGSFVRGFLQVSLIFSAAHGLFLGIILVMLSNRGTGEPTVTVDWHAVAVGSSIVTLLLLGDFLLDLRTLRSWSFADVERLVDRNLARVIIVHMTIIIGMAVVMWTDATRGFFIVFIVLKTMNDLSNVLPQWQPAKPPQWLSSAMNKVPNSRRGKGHKDETFEEFWAKDQQQDKNRRMSNEQPWDRTRNRAVTR